MNFKLGDLVVKKEGSSPLTFVITGFSGEKVLLRGVKLPLITLANTDNLIKVNNKNKTKQRVIKRIK
ncbi:MAG: hypothetical protein ACOC4G_01465 [Bacillota bacterium]